MRPADEILRDLITAQHDAGRFMGPHKVGKRHIPAMPEWNEARHRIARHYHEARIWAGLVKVSEP